MNENKTPSLRNSNTLKPHRAALCVYEALLKAKWLIFIKNEKKSHRYLFFDVVFECQVNPHCYTRGWKNHREALGICKRGTKWVVPGDFEVPTFPHFWEFVIGSSWSHIQQDQRQLSDIFWTYSENYSDYQVILPTNDDRICPWREWTQKEDRTWAACTQRYSIKWFPLLLIYIISPVNGFLAPIDETFYKF